MNPTRHNWQLQQMGITQYVLRQPTVLRGEVAIALPDNANVVLISQYIPPLNTPLMRDILHAMQLTPEHLYCLTPEQATMIAESKRYLVWLMGLPADFSLPEAFVNHLILTSPGLAELAQSAQAKRQFWQQILRHEHDLFAH